MPDGVGAERAEHCGRSAVCALTRYCSGAIACSAQVLHTVYSWTRPQHTVHHTLHYLDGANFAAPQINPHHGRPSAHRAIAQGNMIMTR